MPYVRWECLLSSSPLFFWDFLHIETPMPIETLPRAFFIIFHWYFDILSTTITGLILMPLRYVAARRSLYLWEIFLSRLPLLILFFLLLLRYLYYIRRECQTLSAIFRWMEMPSLYIVLQY
jgi:hypothetical protein